MSGKRAARCPSGGQTPIREHPVTGAGECPTCGRRFDAGELRRNAMGGRRLPSHERTVIYGLRQTLPRDASGKIVGCTCGQTLNTRDQHWVRAERLRPHYQSDQRSNRDMKISKQLEAALRAMAYSAAYSRVRWRADLSKDYDGTRFGVLWGAMIQSLTANGVATTIEAERIADRYIDEAGARWRDWQPLAEQRDTQQLTRQEILT